MGGTVTYGDVCATPIEDPVSGLRFFLLSVPRSKVLKISTNIDPVLRLLLPLPPYHVVDVDNVPLSSSLSSLGDKG